MVEGADDILSTFTFNYTTDANYIIVGIHIGDLPIADIIV